jgi:hypothetical protein
MVLVHILSILFLPLLSEFQLQILFGFTTTWLCFHEGARKEGILSFDVPLMEYEGKIGLVMRKMFFSDFNF